MRVISRDRLPTRHVIHFKPFPRHKTKLNQISISASNKLQVIPYITDINISKKNQLYFHKQFDKFLKTTKTQKPQNCQGTQNTNKHIHAYAQPIFLNFLHNIIEKHLLFPFIFFYMYFCKNCVILTSGRPTRRPLNFFQNLFKNVEYTLLTGKNDRMLCCNSW